MTQRIYPRSKNHQLAPVVQTLDSTIHQINHYPVDKYEENQFRYCQWIESYPADNAIHLSNNWDLASRKIQNT